MKKKQDVDNRGGEEMSSWIKAFTAAFLAWLIPGAGHFYAGRRVRGIIIFATITATFWGGIAIGGVMTVDSRYHPKWFYAQSMTGVNGIVSWYRQHQVYLELSKELETDLSEFRPGERPSKFQYIQVDRSLSEKGIALVTPAEDVARAYSGVAGMMNFLAIFDILMLCLMGRAGEPPFREDGESDGKESKSEVKKNA